MTDIIGAGRIGWAMTHALRARGEKVRLYHRGDPLHTLVDGEGEPLIVTTRNDDLAGVLAALPPNRRADVVLIQNGMLRSFLAEQGLGDVTRGILFFAVQRKNDTPVPGGDSPFFGPRAEVVASRLADAGLPSVVLTDEGFREVELEKLLWNCVFGLLCEAYNATVGQIATEPSASAWADSRKAQLRVSGGAYSSSFR